MVKGLYIAGTNMITNTKKMDVISNNLANVNTTGFKKDHVVSESFNNRLFHRINGSNIPFAPGNPAVTTTFSGEEVTAETDKGYFRVETSTGTHYDKTLRMIKDQDGYLRTVYKNVGGSIDPLQGNFVLGLNGRIFIGEEDFDVDAGGNVLVGGNALDRLVTMTHPGAIGTISAGIRSQNVMVNHEQGQLEMTGNKFDVAIKGDGFFVIDTPYGELYSRNGAFTANALGELVTMDGDRVMGLDGPIYIESDSFTINAFGELIQNGEITDRIQMINFSNVGDLFKVGGTFFNVREEMTGEIIEFEGELVQGFTERSNTDSITEMINLIEMNRNYEASQKVITTIDEMIGKAVTEVGRV